MSNLLKNSLYALYAGDGQVLDMFDSVDWSKLEYKFNKELYSRMDKTTVETCQAILASKVIADYDKAIAESVQACTVEVAQLLDLITYPTNQTGH